jgi:phospholipase C
MMENRSFDHMLGWLHQNYSNIDGLTGKEFNRYDVKDPTSKAVYVNQNGFDTGPDDPGHSWSATAEEIFGSVIDPTKKGTPEMNGFVQNAVGAKHDPENPMSMFTNKTAPIINTLAVEFGVFNRWFAALPGPTDPNRAFFMSGTSNGAIDNFNGTLWSQQSYFNFLSTHKVSWRAYYQDDPWAIMYFQDMHEASNHQYVGELTQFFTDIKAGTLAQFTVLQPRMTSVHGAPTWQHPDASVKAGEALYKQIYETLRASPFWEKLAFIITYDEHGGFYDHVAPPQDGVPSPDGVLAPNKFGFDRLGIRLPTLVISPWIPKNSVVGEPTGPTATSQYDSTSIIATVNKIFNITEHLTKRDAWSGTFEKLFFQLSTPRTDCPMTLPDVPETTAEELETIRNLPLNDHIATQVQFYCKFNNHGEDCGKDITNQLQASQFILKEVDAFWDRIRGSKNEQLLTEL